MVESHVVLLHPTQDVNRRFVQHIYAIPSTSHWVAVSVIILTVIAAPGWHSGKPYFT